MIAKPVEPPPSRKVLIGYILQIMLHGDPSSWALLSMHFSRLKEKSNQELRVPIIPDSIQAGDIITLDDAGIPRWVKQGIPLPNRSNKLSIENPLEISWNVEQDTIDRVLVYHFEYNAPCCGALYMSNIIIPASEQWLWNPVDAFGHYDIRSRILDYLDRQIPCYSCKAPLAYKGPVILHYEATL